MKEKGLTISLLDLLTLFKMSLQQYASVKESIQDYPLSFTIWSRSGAPCRKKTFPESPIGRSRMSYLCFDCECDLLKGQLRFCLYEVFKICKFHSSRKDFKISKDRGRRCSHCGLDSFFSSCSHPHQQLIFCQALQSIQT